MRTSTPLISLAALLIAGLAHAGDPKAIYQGTCIACHGPATHGAIPGVPDLVKTGRLGKPDAVLVNSILNGAQTPGAPLAMPAKGGNPTLTAADAQALITYMRALGSPSK